MDKRLLLPVAALLAAPASAQGADDCGMAQAITGMGPHAFDTTLATTDGVPDPLCFFFNNDDIFNDVWFSWTAQDTGDHILSLCGGATVGDTKVAVYAGACGSAAIACNDDSCGLISEVTFTATAGQSYLFRVGNFSETATPAVGDFTVRVDAPLLNPGNGHYYRLVNEQRGWLDADSTARSMIWQGSPGYLATITDQAELDWILNNLSPARPWIGLFHNTASPNYSEPGGGWEWVTGEPLSFTNWAPGEPNNTSASGGPEDYCEMFGNGQWNDAEEGHNFTTQFLVEWDGGSLGTNYCTAEANSTGATGSISASGSLLVSDNDLTLTATDLPNSAFGFFLTSQTQGFVQNPGGSAGNLCLGGAIGRFVGPGQIQNTGQTGEISLVVDLTQVPTPTGLVAILPGQTWNFQAWHRDAVGGSATSNFSDGLEAMFF